MLNFIVWNIKPQIVDLGSFEIRYYSLLFAAAFVIGYIIMARIIKKEGLNQELLDKLTVYVVLSTIIGARLGHCLFYEFDYYIKHPLEIILPWRGKIGEDFRFTGYQGLASHGAAIGILTGIYLFVRKTKVTYLWTLDRLVILVALAGSFIRTGNLMNSEIYGNPTNSDYGFIYVYDFTKMLHNYDKENIKKVTYKKAAQDTLAPKGSVPLELNVQFSRRIKDEDYISSFVSARRGLKNALYNIDYQKNIICPDISNLTYRIEKQNRNYILKALVYGVPKYPTQIYEALAYLLIFIFLLWLYYKKKEKLKDGYILGMFFLLVFLARFFIEFLKENQEEFENALPINMGQILSIPFILFGITMIIIKRPKKAEE